MSDLRVTVRGAGRTGAFHANAVATRTTGARVVAFDDHPVPRGLRHTTNPPGDPVRGHQHTEAGRGDVDGEDDEVFAALVAVGFDGVVSSCVPGVEEDARATSERQRDAAALAEKHPGAETAATLTR